VFFDSLQGLSSRHKEEEIDEREPKPCPKCGSTDTRLSRRHRGVIALFLTMINMSRYRCRACKRHFVGKN